MFIVHPYRLLDLQRRLDRHFDNFEWIDLEVFRKKLNHHQEDWTGLYEFRFGDDWELDYNDLMVKIFEIDPDEYDLTTNSYLQSPYFKKINFHANREPPRISSVNPSEI